MKQEWLEIVISEEKYPVLVHWYQSIWHSVVHSRGGEQKQTDKVPPSPSVSHIFHLQTITSIQGGGQRSYTGFLWNDLILNHIFTHIKPNVEKKNTKTFATNNSGRKKCAKAACQ